jgi:hypothetical protein
VALVHLHRALEAREREREKPCQLDQKS